MASCSACNARADSSPGWMTRPSGPITGMRPVFSSWDSSTGASSDGTDTLMGKENVESSSATPSMPSSLSSSRPLFHSDFTAPPVADTPLTNASLLSEKSLCGVGVWNDICGMLPGTANVSGISIVSCSKTCNTGAETMEHSESMVGSATSTLDNDVNGLCSSSKASSSAIVAISMVGKPPSSCRFRPRLQITRNSIGVSCGRALRLKTVDGEDGCLVSMEYSSAAI